MAQNYADIVWTIDIEIGPGVRIGPGVTIGANAKRQNVDFETEVANDLFISESGTDNFILEENN